MAEMRRRDREFGLLVGDRMRSLREHRRWSVFDLADASFLDPDDVDAVEAGNPVPATWIRRMAEVLGAEPHELLNPAVSFEYYSVFLSYGGPDEAIAAQIQRALKKQGVKCFFFPETATPGKRLHRTMSEGVASHDRVVLLCSENSLNRPGVQNELEQVLVREAQEGGTELLIPIALDDYVFSEWSPKRADMATQIRTRVVADFRGLRRRSVAWKRQIDRLLAALRKPARSAS